MSDTPSGEVEQDSYDASPPNHNKVNGQRVERIAYKDYASTTTVYQVDQSEIFHADRSCDRIPDTAWPSAWPLPDVMSSYIDPIKPCSSCTMDIKHCAEVAVEHDGMLESQLSYYLPGDKRVNETYTRNDDGVMELSNRTATEVYDD